MKTNKHLAKFALLAFAVLLTFAASAEAQRKKPVTKKPVTPAVNTNSLEVKDTAKKVSDQLMNVVSFSYSLGGAASAIEALEADVRANKLSKAQLDKFTQQKQTLIQTIVNLKAGLAALEVEFRTKPSIKNYQFQIQGVTDLATQSEDLARGGKFNESGKALIQVVQKLADTLTAMP